jgi:hypothetical protein
MIRAITAHGTLNHAIKKVLAQKIEIMAVIGFAAEGLGCSIEAPFTPNIGTRLRRTATITRTLVYEFSSERGDKPPLRAQPYSSHRRERSLSHG